ncbi:formimidoylglutamate deiminase [Arthrobacter sp. CAU 1506]|uniref:formimidoylglutamate deiminase n=1 Tax=Arthrobacter sp. CAU 1506 TaxID=2560052 RepID=UPI0010AD3399|nr:formimidoylglutamate deiminase [Arthrobacter sp. CAU 1506]TJY72277.1 formimidoylglutamate deiminase [Arthrobacter sp. CAU 1506]
MSRIWCERAWLGPEGVADNILLENDDGGAITHVGTAPRPDPGAGVLTLDGVVFPAAANAHSHAFHRALRGRTHTGRGDFWTWREQMYRAAGALTPGKYERLATAVFAEMVTAGFSSVAEFHYVHHRPDGAAYGSAAAGDGPEGAGPRGEDDDLDSEHAMELALCRAAAAAGIRLTLLDTCYLAGGIGKPLAPEQQRFGDGDVHAWLDRLDSLRKAVAARFDPARITVGAALHSVRGVPESALPVIADRLSPELPLHIHLSEQPAENEACLAEYGVTPAGLLARHGLLSPRLSAVHATHLTAEDIDLLGGAGATVVMCPTTEADLADGIGPARALADAGARIALGTDQHAVVDPWLEMRALEHGERLASGQRGRFTPDELLQAASAGAVAAMGTPTAGIAVGLAADLAAVNPATMRTVGSDPGQLPLTATSADVTAVVVGGELLAANGVHSRLGQPADLLAAALKEIA